MNEEVLHLLDDVFSKHCPPHQWMQIDRLEIDLGSLDPNDIQRSIREVFQKNASESINQVVNSSASSGFSERDATPAQGLSLKDSQKDRAQSDALQTLSKLERERAMLIHFFQLGYMPWWVSLEDAPDLDKVVEHLLEQKDSYFLEKLLGLLSQSGVTDRLVSQLSNAIVYRLIRALYPKEHFPVFAFIFSVASYLKEQRPAAYQRSTVLSSLWREFQQQIEARSKTLTEQQVVAVFLHLSKYLVQSSAQLPADWLSKYIFFLDKAITTSSQVGDKNEWSFISSQSLLRLVKQAAKQYHQHKVEGKSQGAASHQTQVSENVYPTTKKEAEGHLPHDIPCSHAGLVLLWPYLSGFFKKLKWVEQKAFVSDVAQQQAVGMLHYLATGEQSAFEYELLLPKILCGLHASDPVGRFFNFEQAVYVEAEVLLTSAIANWPILKNTSIDGFRETFLKRPGLICQVKGQYQVRIERKGVDVLLDQLPYGLSMILLPWRKEMMSCQW